MIDKAEFHSRVAKLRARMSARGIDALVTGASAQMEFKGVLRYLINYYLPVFEEYLVVTHESVVFFAHDASGAAFARKFGTPDEIRIIPGHEYNSDPGKCVAAFLKSAKCDKIAVAGLAGLSANFYLSLLRNLGTEHVFDFTDELNRIRMIKSPLEIKLSEAAIRLNEDVFYYWLGIVKPGICEVDAVNDASAFALENGAEELYWMAASGPVPKLRYFAEARSERHIWSKGDYAYIILEHSGEGGYWGETTQLISLGEPKPEYVRAFSAVSEAQKAAAAKIKTGALVGELAETAAKVLADLGYPEPAAIGHSQGADVWEFPRIVRGEETIIEPGMRFNLHPGIVLPDGALIASCDCWISEEGPARRLSTTPDEIIVL